MRLKVSRGERLSERVARLRSNLHLGQWRSDVLGFLRVDDSDERYHPFHYLPVFPASPIAAHVHDWQWKKDEDVGTGAFDVSASGAGVGVAVENERGNVIKFTNGVADNNFYWYASKYEPADLQAGGYIWFRTSFRILDVDQADVFIGLLEPEGVTGKDFFDDRVDSVGFYMTDGSAALNAEASKDGIPTQATGLATMADDTYVTVGFIVEALTRVRFYVNDVYVNTIATNLPDDETLAFCFGCRNGQAVANALSVRRTILMQDE